jgi:hypothetical protein
MDARERDLFKGANPGTHGVGRQRKQEDEDGLVCCSVQQLI